MFHLLNWCYVFCEPSGFRRNNAVSLYWYQGEGRECFASAGISVWVSRWKDRGSLWAEGCLSEWRKNKKKERKEPGFVFLVNAGIGVWIPRREVRVSQGEPTGDIYVNRKERGSGFFCFRELSRKGFIQLTAEVHITKPQNDVHGALKLLSCCQRVRFLTASSL